MIKRILLYLGIVIFFIVMLLIMNTKLFIDGPIGSDKTLPSILADLKEQIHTENWKQAQNTRAQLEDTWRRFLLYAQISLEKSEVEDFEGQLIRLQTALEFSDKPKALDEIRLMSQNWKTLGQ